MHSPVPQVRGAGDGGLVIGGWGAAGLHWPDAMAGHSVRQSGSAAAAVGGAPAFDGRPRRSTPGVRSVEQIAPVGRSELGLADGSNADEREGRRRAPLKRPGGRSIEQTRRAAAVRRLSFG
jgi:hypothetical protein